MHHITLRLRGVHNQMSNTLPVNIGGEEHVRRVAAYNHLIGNFGIKQS